MSARPPDGKAITTTGPVDTQYQILFPFISVPFQNHCHTLAVSSVMVMTNRSHPM
jgi:hypothetical protein